MTPTTTMAATPSLPDRFVAGVLSSTNESQALGWARSLIAVAQLTVLLVTPASYLFVPVGGRDQIVSCETVAQHASAYCLAGSLDRQLLTWLLAAGLVVVASGILPRFTAPIHWWITLSIGASISLPDGGESVAQVVTFFLMIALINDRRRWHWQRGSDRHRYSAWQGVAWAGAWGIRLQVAYIYVNSAVAKLSVGPWQDGTATYYTARMENFGAAGLLDGVVRWSSAVPVLALATSWGAIATELLIAVLLLRSGRGPIVALGLSAALHVAIIIQLGIVSFALIIVGAVACAAAPAIEKELARRRHGPSHRVGEQNAEARPDPHGPKQREPQVPA